MMLDLKIIDNQEGTGQIAKDGHRVHVHYNGALENGQIFDNSYKRGRPLAFTLGIGQVIEGWDKGIKGMKIGGKRTLTIPPHMGYGAEGAGSLIPPHATLIFDVELISID